MELGLSVTDVAVACLCVALMVVGLRSLARGHFELDLWLLVGVGLWAAGLALVVLAAFRQDALFPNHGHLLWWVGIPVMVIGVLRATRPGHGYQASLVGVDLTMVTAAWMMLVWHVAVHPTATQPVDQADYLRISALLMEVLLVVVFGLLAANHPVPHLVGLTVGTATIAVSETIAANLDGEDAWQSTPSVVRLVLLVIGVVVTIGSLALVRELPRRSDHEMIKASRRRNLITVTATMVPLAIVVVIVPDRPNGPVPMMLGLVVLVCFGVHEALTIVPTGRLLERLSEQAVLDPLTGLGNRRALTEALAREADAGESMCLINLDIDSFKEVNRQVGHGAGDRVLTAVARELDLLPVGQAFRLGGDEFAVLCNLQTYEALAVAERVRLASATAIASVPDVAPLAVTVSVGVAGWQAHAGEDALEVLTRSALALRVAKSGRDRVRLFSDADAAALEYRDSLEQCLRQALHERAIDFFYQPIVRISDGVVVAVESLARWKDPILGVLSPAEFVAVAEETGLIDELGRQALEAAVDEAVRLRSANRRVSVSVNVSPVQLRRPVFDLEVRALLDLRGLPPELLTLEVTEGVFIDVDDPAAAMLDRLAEIGVGISIDDFGSGYSSLGYITRMPATVIKIDRTLTQQVDQPRSRSIISAILGVAAAHDLKVVLEGVETRETANALSALGAELAQGWLFGPAVAPEHLPDVIDDLATGPNGIPGPRMPSG